MIIPDIQTYGRHGQPIYGTAAFLRRNFRTPEECDHYRSTLEDLQEMLRLSARYRTQTVEDPENIVFYNE